MGTPADKHKEGPNHQDVGGLEWLQNKQTHVIPARHKQQTKNSYCMPQAWTVAYLHIKNNFESKGNLYIQKNIHMQSVSILFAKKYPIIQSENKVILCSGYSHLNQ